METRENEILLEQNWQARRAKEEGKILRQMQEQWRLERERRLRAADRYHRLSRILILGAGAMMAVTLAALLVGAAAGMVVTDLAVTAICYNGSQVCEAKEEALR